MGVRDALLHNTTGSNFEALQSNDTARIKGDFSIKNTSNAEIFGVDVSTGEVTVAANITSSGDISSSLSSTGSFGRVVATTFHGDGALLRDSLPRSPGLVTGSAQIAADISGAFDAGFFFGFQTSSSISGGLGISASFGRLQGNKFYGDGSGMASTLPRSTGILSSSAQIAADISGSFNKGFDFDGTIDRNAGGTWSTAASMNRTVRYLGGLGSVNAALGIGGYEVATQKACTEEYNGSSWSEVNDLPVATAKGGASGTTEAGLFFGGRLVSPHSTRQTYEWNGTNWSEVNDLGADSVHITIGAGSTSEAAIAGLSTSANNMNDWYEWDGTNWSEMSTNITVRGRNQGGGESTEAAIIIGGDDTPTCVKTNYTEIWNGSNWSEVGDTIHPRRYGSFAGTTNDGIVMSDLNDGGLVEVWNGTAWSETSNLISAAGGHGSAGAGRVGVGSMAGGAHKIGGGVFSTPASELFSAFSYPSASFGRLDASNLVGDATNLQSTLPYSSGLVTSSAQLASRISGSFNKGFTFTTTSSLGHPTGSLISAQVGAWSVGGNLNTGRNNHNSCTGAGVAAANAVSLFGGKVPASPNYTGKTENYDGTSWSESGDLDEARTDGASFGTQTAGVYAGGEQGGSAPNNGTTFTEEFNGSSWSEVTAYPQAMVYATGAGTQGAGLVAFGGQSPAPTPNGNRGGTYSVEYNGTNWVNASTAADFGPTHSSQIRHSMAGIQNAAITVGNGDSPPGGAPYMWCTVMNYDGAAWSIGTSTPNGTKWSSLAGTQNDVLSAGGYSSPQGPWNGSSTFAQRFNGTAWSDISSLINNQVAAGGAGLTSYQMTMYGGYTEGAPSWTGYVDDTQEYCEGIANLTVDRLKANHLTGDGSFLKNFYPNMASSSAQLASDISGSFNKGFDLAANSTISGSTTSTGSFGQVYSNDFRGDGSELSNIPLNEGLVSGSAQLATQISGSFNKGFEYTGTIQVAPGGVWTAGGTLNANTTEAAGIGTKAAGLAVGSAAASQKTEEYNGSNWSEVNDLITGRGDFVGTGTTEASIVYGGHSSKKTCTEEFNGTNWSEVNDMIMGRHSHMKLGITSEAALAAGGNTTEGGYEDADVEVWNGTNWSAGTAMLSAAAYGSSAGTYDSGLIFKWPGSETFCWNGTNWSEVADRVLPKYSHAGGGSSNDAFIAGGTSPATSPSVNSCTELFNGTTWSTGPSLINARSELTSADGGNAGTGTTMVFGGGSPGTQTEEFTLNTASASFGRVENATYSGDGSSIKSSLGGRSAGVISGSKQISAQISGSFTSGFESTGNISGSATSTGSFGLLKPRAGGIDTKAFQVTSSLFKLPVFSDRELNYQAYESQLQTGSLSGSVDRVADVIVGQNLGEMWFDSDKNAVGYTYQSSSLISQSLNIGTFTNISASGAYQSSSQGFFTQSFYSHTVVTCYLTGSQI